MLLKLKYLDRFLSPNKLAREQLILDNILAFSLLFQYELDISISQCLFIDESHVFSLV